MANSLYGKAREAFANADIDLLVDDIRVILVDTGAYTVSINIDDFLDDIAGGARIAVSSALASKDTTLGVFDAADKTLTAVTGAQSEALVLYVHTGTDATSRLIGYIDTATNLPITPNGGDITIAWDNGANKIFKL